LSVFYSTFGILVESPLLALIPAALFLAAARIRRSRISGVAGTAWIVYTLYELGMRARWLCSGECNIRVDLLAIYPALAVLSLVAVVALFKVRHEPRA
jgi:ABC-type transport system involved in cytochrome c biogenesis permease subunit